MAEPDAYQANFQRGTQLVQLGRYREAIPFLQAAIAANPHVPQAYAQLARAWNEIPSQRAKVIPTVNRAIALAPNASATYGLKAWFLVYQMRHKTACQVANQGLALNPVCIPSLNALANAHTKLHQWKQAEAACLRVLQIDPNDAPALNLLAQALRNMGRWKESRAIVARLLANMPNNAFGHTNAGYAALAAGDHLRANEHFREALRLNPHFDFARRGLIQSLRARVWILRLNMRMIGLLRRPATFLNVALGIFGVVALFVLIIYSSLLLEKIYPDLRDGYFGILFLVPVAYFILLGLVANIVNFMLMFDPIGRHALTREEKMKASLPVFLLVFIIGLQLLAQQWGAALGLISFIAFLILSFQLPLLRDRWLRRRLSQVDSN